MDPYLYPGTQVLANLRGIQDSDKLAQFEADATSLHILELEYKSPPSLFYLEDYLDLHHWIFRDVYKWAGELRTVELSLGNQVWFGPKAFIAQSLHQKLNELREENFLRNTSNEYFCKRAAYFLGELNAIHPFRDGNGQTVHWFRITRDQMKEASIQSFQRGDTTGFEKLLLAALNVPKN